MKQQTEWEIQDEADVDLIKEERRRQIAAEGFSSSHDDDHDTGELLQAAICYAQSVLYLNPKRRSTKRQRARAVEVPSKWPWDKYDWKPTPGDWLRQLAKAGALIAAEMDRMIRQAEREAPESNDDDDLLSDLYVTSE